MIDTNQIITDYAMTWEDDGSMLSTKPFKAFSVFVINTPKDTLGIGYGEHLPMIIEAVNKRNEWQALEEPYT